MRSGEYVVLRLEAPKEAGLGVRGSNAVAAAEADLRVDVESLEKRHLSVLHRDPRVLGMAPPMPTHLVVPFASHLTDDVDGESGTWGVEVTGASASPYTGSGVTVAVLDTGIDAEHEAFSGLVVEQRDFTGEGDGDRHGHGTHCAGTIAGRSAVGRRIGVAPGIARLLVGKVFDADGRGSTEQIGQAIQWAAEQGAHVVSMSLGFDFTGMKEELEAYGYPPPVATSQTLEAYRANIRLFDTLAAHIRARGALGQTTLLVAASGNESKRDVSDDYELGVAPPAAADGVLSVSALRTMGRPHDSLTVADFSNTGADVAAPGEDVYSAWTGGGYQRLSGTSMATPHVAGIAALWAESQLEEAGTLNILELTSSVVGRASRSRLAAGVDPADVGAGLVQAPVG